MQRQEVSSPLRDHRSTFISWNVIDLLHSHGIKSQASERFFVSLPKSASYIDIQTL